MNTIEHVEQLTIAQGETNETVSFTPPAGMIQRAVIYYDTKNNDGFVNASIEDDTGRELSKAQHIDNYRSRDSSYLDCKPLYCEGGRKLHFKVNADQAFTGAFKCQLILIYFDNGNPQNC